MKYHWTEFYVILINHHYMHHFSCFSLTFYNQYYARTSQEHDLSIISFFISSIFVLPCWAYIHHEYIYIWKWLSKTSIFFSWPFYILLTFQLHYWLLNPNCIYAILKRFIWFIYLHCSSSDMEQKGNEVVKAIFYVTLMIDI